MLLLVSVASADDTNNLVYSQGDIDYPVPYEKQSYYAKVAPMSSGSSTYLGADVGIGYYIFKPELSVKKSQEEIVGDKKNRLNYKAGLFGGYGAHVRQFYLGGELGAAYNFLDREFGSVVNGQRLNLVMKQPANVTLDLLPGYLNRAETLLWYARAGLALGYFRLKLTDYSAQEEIKAHDDRVKLGYRVGGGLEYLISDMVSLRMEYVYHRYGGVDASYKHENVSYKYQLRSTQMHQVNLGFLIRF